ncbi:MAG: nicotinate-nucleotide--dimethylbenzimidazole phosphoribosyltransferase [Sediminibacterium sp.]
MDLHTILLNRRDTRHFTTAPVPEEVLQKALSAAHLAPSVGLSEAVRFYVIKEAPVKQSIYDLFESENNETRRTLAADSNTLSRYNAIKLQAILEAPVGIIVTTDYAVLNQFTIGVSGTADTLQWSSVCAVQNMWLSLTEQGYSLGWVSILNYNKLKNLLQFPAHEFPLGYFCIGKPATDYAGQPMLQQINWKEKAAMPVVKEIREVVQPIQQQYVPVVSATCQAAENDELRKELLQLINNKTKPAGALGQLEDIALQTGLILQTSSPEIRQAHLVVFAADHGIAKTGLVNPYPQAVTTQMVRNFLKGGAAINVFCKQHQIALKIVDAGVNHVWKQEEVQNKNFIDCKMGYGTRNYLDQPAMTEEEVLQAIEKGKQIVQELAAGDCNCIGLGEMGIGNTSSASLIMSAVTGVAVRDCIGSGTGASVAQLKTKTTTLETVYKKHKLYELKNKPISLLAKIGGFEIAMMAGAYLQATKEKMIIVVDGFIATAALLPALQLDQNILHHCIFAHTSGEQGHEKMLTYLKADPLLNLGMRLGEGTGAALAIPLVRSAVNFLNEMANFESARIDTAVK